MKRAYTTGQVARICQVAPRTVAKWVDNGSLVGYRVPGSADRRIPHPQLLAFLRAHNMPLDYFLHYYPQDVVVITAAAERYLSLRQALQAIDEDLRAIQVAGDFLAGCRVLEKGVACVVVDALSLGEKLLSQVLARHSEGNHKALPCIGIVSLEVAARLQGVEIFIWPYDPSLLAHRVARRVEEYHTYLQQRVI